MYILELYILLTPMQLFHVTCRVAVNGLTKRDSSLPSQVVAVIEGDHGVGRHTLVSRDIWVCLLRFLVSVHSIERENSYIFYCGDMQALNGIQRELISDTM